jgi:hypothetical protein
LEHNRYLERSSPTGKLQVWEQPEAGKRYIIGIDSAGGGAKSDFAVACVVEESSAGVVAIMRAREDAHDWARRCVRLGAKYNTALLAYETYPSYHGGVAVRYTLDVLKYTNIYRSVRVQSVSIETSANLGWKTDVSGKPMMIERVKLALAEGVSIPSKELIDDLRRRRWIGKPDTPADSWKMGGKGNDDMFVAYSIAMCVRDLRAKSAPRTEEKKRTTDRDELFWERREKELQRFYGRRERHHRRLARAV